MRVRPRNLRRVVFQLVGFAIGIGLLGWCVWRAWEEMTPEHWRDLADAPAHEVIALVLLSVATIVLNGMTWWFSIRPVRRLGFVRTQAVNAVATALSFLPAKISIVFRLVVHNRRDGIPVLTMGGWLGAMAVIMAAVFGPALGMSVLRQRADTLWWIGTVGGAAAATTAVILLARLFSTGPGWRGLERFMGRVLGHRGRRFMAHRRVAEMHAGVVMLASPSATAAGALTRLTDALGTGLRFYFAARILDAHVGLADAVVASIVFFVIGSIAPTGTAGVREAGTTGALALFGSQKMFAIVVFVSAVEIVVSVLCALAGAAAMGLRRKEIEEAAQLAAEGEGDGLPEVL